MRAPGCFRRAEEQNKVSNEFGLINFPFCFVLGLSLLGCSSPTGECIRLAKWSPCKALKQKFGEALESQRHKNKIDSKFPAKSLFGITSAANGFDDEVQMVTLSNEENSQARGTLIMYNIEKENVDLTDQSEIKTPILFKDVDAILTEDHGFLSTIQQLALTAKRPMILTSNEDGSVLPNNLERLAVPFEIPLAKELLGLGRVLGGSRRPAFTAKA